MLPSNLTLQIRVDCVKVKVNLGVSEIDRLTKCVTVIIDFGTLDSIHLIFLRFFCEIIFSFFYPKKMKLKFIK